MYADFRYELLNVIILSWQSFLQNWSVSTLRNFWRQLNILVHNLQVFWRGTGKACTGRKTVAKFWEEVWWPPLNFYTVPLEKSQVMNQSKNITQTQQLTFIFCFSLTLGVFSNRQTSRDGSETDNMKYNRSYNFFTWKRFLLRYVYMKDFCHLVLRRFSVVWGDLSWKI
jgi:hypothetical protein